MATGSFISYLRVSTARQGASGLGLEAQRATIRQHLDGGQWTLLGEHVEIESGKRADRPALAKALNDCRLTGATLAIAKLDRLSRNVAFLQNLMDSGVEFTAVDNATASRFTLHILAAVAEHEATMISSTKVALAAAKARGVKLGGHRDTLRDGSLNAYVADPTAARAALRERAAAFVSGVGPLVQAMRQEGLSLRQIGARLTERGVRTARAAPGPRMPSR